MYSRKQYMNNECTHEEYYRQFITEGTKNTVLNKFDILTLKSRFKDDKNLNNIPLKTWDNLPKFYNSKLMKELGDNLTMAGHVCIMKQAAIMLIEEATK